ncbi:MAG: cobalt ECF transporter T component CbiQ [Chloroflexi bacterium]|nr:cobalt ECF transporter T component CbiQ [Chloroflexota bacterium]MCL5109137.1 cobalt ECF transporter T component CbiQ [Chloroflexota bacterium]
MPNHHEHEHRHAGHGLGFGHSHEHNEFAEVATEDEQVLDREKALGGVGPRAKLIALAAALLVNLVAPSPLTGFVIFLVAVALLLRAGIAGRTVTTRLLVPWYFAAVAFLTQVFLTGQTPLFTLGPAVASAEGLAHGLTIASRVIGGTAAVLVVSMTTPMTGMLATAAWLRVPPIVVEIAALTYRYVFLLAEEAERIREAQKTRLGHSTWRNSMRSYGILGGMVVVNSYDRAERVYQAMLLRGYRGDLPVPAGEAGFTSTDVKALFWVALGLAAALGLGLLV